jgi:hypothetical protein
LPAGREPTLFPRESIYDNGTNVGIGTTDVGSYKLNVNGTVNATGYYVSGTALSPTVAGTITGQTLYWNGSAWTASVNLFNNNTNVGIGTTNPTQLFQINNSGSSAFVVTSGGNVGIGTTSPTDKLVLQGENSEATLGSEQVTNGNFSTDPSGNWTYSSPWTWDNTNYEMDYAGSGGAVEAVAINNGGTGYTVNDVVTLSGGGNNATCTVTSVGTGGVVTGISVTAGGTGYSHTSYNTTGGTGSGLNLQVTDVADGSTLSQNVSVTAGNTYQVVFTTKNTSGNGRVRVTLGGVQSSAYAAGDQTNFTVLITTTGTGNLILTPTADFTGTIDDVSVKRITQTINSLATLKNSDGTTGLEIRSGGTSNYGVFIGYQAGIRNTTGDYNTAIGYQSLYSNTTGYYNNALGYQSLYSNTTGGNNNALGYQSLYSNTTGGTTTLSATILSTPTLREATTTLSATNLSTPTLREGQQRSRLPFSLLQHYGKLQQRSRLPISLLQHYGRLQQRSRLPISLLQHYGNYNNALGPILSTPTLREATTTLSAPILSTPTLRDGTTTLSATVLSTPTLRELLAQQRSRLPISLLQHYGNYNNALGREAGYYSQTGSGNFFVGYQAGRGAATYTGSDYNTIIGYQAGYNIGSNQDYNIFLGYQAGYSETGSNKLYIANGNNKALIYGDMSTGLVGIGGTAAHTNPYIYVGSNGNVGIGTTGPAAR